jgi:hypothetical protein
MQKKQDTNTKYHSINLNSKEVFQLKEILELYLLEKEALNYLDTKKIKGYSVYMKVKNLIALYELQNPITED